LYDVKLIPDILTGSTLEKSKYRRILQTMIDLKAMPITKQVEKCRTN
jgi:hypothetical protein